MPSKARINWILSISACFCLFLTVIWVIWAAPELHKMPEHFVYTADILSLDNFYDEKSQKFEGEHISKTYFTYEVVKIHPDYNEIKNLITVRKLSDEPIFSVSRIYFINPYTGQHVSVPGQKSRYGYLFAPRYVNKNNFDYWHVNYDAPAHMKFLNKEVIDGLTVYHYMSKYQADQTSNLRYLPEVPEKRGIGTDITLQLWIEPISGWLVKYQDNTLAYYYDIKTGKKLYPWNRFTNFYTLNSIHQQVIHATWLKWKILLIDFGIPLILILIAISLFLIAYRQKYNQGMHSAFLQFIFKMKISPLTIYIIVFIVISFSLYYLFLYKKPPIIYKIGISQWDNNAELLSAIQGFKDGLSKYGYDEKKNVKFIIKNPSANIKNQIDIIQSFVDDKVNLIFTLTTQGTLIAKGITKKIPIIFTDVTYPIQSDIMTQSNKNNLAGTRNYISPAIQFNKLDKLYPKIKTLAFIHQKGDSDSKIQFLEYKNMLEKRGIQVIEIAVIDKNDLYQHITDQITPYDAIFVACDPLMRSGAGQVVAELSLKHKIPGLTCDKQSVIKGLLIGYFADLYETGRQAGIKAALILQGANPDWLQADSPSQGYLIVNEKTAELLNITLPEDMLKQADYIVRK